MAVHEAVVFGIGILMIALFELWYNLRQDHKELSILFFGMGLVMMNVLTFTILQYMNNDANISYLSGYSHIIFLIVFWFSIVVMLWIIFNAFFGFMKVFANWVCAKLGWRLPFEKE